MTDSVPLPFTVSQAVALLRTTPHLLRIELGGLPEEVLLWRPAADEWCINEVIGHLIAADNNGFAGRIATILALDQPDLDLWDIAGAVAVRRDCEREMEVVLSEFEEVRERGVRMVEVLTDEQLHRPGIHPLVGELRIIDVLHEWLHHDQRHIKQILGNIQAYVWPNMGNAQLFSKPDTLQKLEQANL